ncbi:MAG: hypothetical protein JSW10_08150 [Pseudomonadota bacterium]|nr:MAG: hypothetical protein JSW10_08150 [Pseudomonadota bacterium]
MNTGFRTVVQRLVVRAAPASVLAVGTDCAMFDAYLADHPQCRFECIRDSDIIARIDECAMVDLALVSGVLERLDKQVAGMLVARLRDLHARHVLIAVPIGPHWSGHRSHWEPTDLIALGMVRIGRFGSAERPLHLYTYDLHDYKPTPDWLNARHWANPELFDKFWW